MREAIRSQLRMALLIWAAAGLTFVVGYCAAVGILIFGIYEAWRSFSSSNPTLAGIGPMVLGCGLQLLIAFIFVGIRERFEDRCWQIVAADGGTSVSNRPIPQVLADQTDGEANALADVRAR